MLPVTDLSMNHVEAAAVGTVDVCIHDEQFMFLHNKQDTGQQTRLPGTADADERVLPTDIKNHIGGR